MSLKRRMLRWTLVLAGMAALGFLVVVSGIIPIKASSGHWAITEWFLHFSMRRSVSTHSTGVKPPDLADPGLILRGAGHYEAGCRPCHGSPGTPQPVIPAHMTPHPPDLSQTVPTWDAQELFYIVKHGVKFTGMPAWPAQHRDDEVWAVVAFLLKLPELDEAGYRGLVHGDDKEYAEAPSLPELGGAVAPDVMASCIRCHGRDGAGRGAGAFPRLAGQRFGYLRNALEAFATGQRASGIMQPMVASLSDDAMRALASYYSSLPPAPPAATTNHAEAVARGRTIATRGIPERKVPSCADCHGPVTPPPKSAYPRLAGQDADYLVLQLELFQKGHRGGSEHAHLMHPVASRLTRQQMADAARFYESLNQDENPEERPAAER